MLEDDFSYVLGADPTGIEYAVLTLLSLAVLVVESVRIDPHLPDQSDRSPAG